MPVYNITQQEWENSNSYRRYPFADDVSRTSTNGFKLDDSIFVDGMFHPIDLEGELYLSAVDAFTGELVISDSANGNEKGRGTLQEDFITFTDTFGRHAGKLVLGSGGEQFLKLIGSYTFTVDATRFAPSVVFPQNQRAVRGIRTPDGAVLTGDVTFVGENGVRVIVEEAADGTDVLTVNAVGIARRPEGSRLGDPIKHIYISQPGASVLSIRREENIIFLGHCLPLEELCGGKEYLPRPGGKLPPHADTRFGVDRDTDPCEDPSPPPPPVICPDPLPYGNQEPEHLGFFYFVSESDNIFLCNTSNPAAGFELQGLGSPIAPGVGAEGDCADDGTGGTDLVIRQLPPRDQQGLIFSGRVQL